MSPPVPSIRVGSIVVVLVLAAVAPATVVGIDASSATETAGATTDPDVGNLSAMLPPPDSAANGIRSAAESDQLVPTDSVHPNGTVVFRLDGSVSAESSNSTLGDDLQFSMHQTDRTTTPERLPLKVNTSESGDAIQTFTVDADRYVVVDLQNATWEYDGEPGTRALEPRPRVAHGYVATLELTSNGTTVSRNTTVQLTEPQIADDSEVSTGGVTELRVGMPGTWTATLVVGNESAGHRVALQLVDADADGEVLVRVDTDATEPDEAFTGVGPDTVRLHPADDGFTTWNGTLQLGNYSLGVGVADPATVAADRYGWGPVLTVVQATPDSSTRTPTPTASPTPPATQSATPTDTITATTVSTPMTAESPGFSVVVALLSLVMTLFTVMGWRAGH